jgi:hypothetical protein
LPNHLKPRAHSRTLNRDLRTKSASIRRLSPYCTQTNFLYVDSVCSLSARIEISRPSLEFWTCSGTVGAHSYFFRCVFLSLFIYFFFGRIWAANSSKDIYFILYWGFAVLCLFMKCALCRLQKSIKKGDAIDFLAVIWSQHYRSWEKNRNWLSIKSVKANLMEGGIASRNFVSFLWIQGPILWIKSQSYFSSFREIPESRTIIYKELAMKVVSVLNTVV